MPSGEDVIETWAREEYREGFSPGAAARQLCRSLGVNNAAPTLKRMLETMLADANRASFERAQILNAFEDAAPEQPKTVRSVIFNRINERAT